MKIFQHIKPYFNKTYIVIEKDEKNLKSGDHCNSSGKKYEYDGAFGKGQLCAIGKCERCALHKKMESKLQII